MNVSSKNSLLSAIMAFTIWGLVPLYWRPLASVSAYEIVAHRVWWAFIFVLLLVYALGLGKAVKDECRALFKNSGKLLLITAAAFLVTGNWLIYIWAVNDNRVLETSLGYYINPLVNVLMGVLLLKEKMSFWQTVAIFFAAAGVFYMAVNFGRLPWVSFALAITMGLYGLCKKVLHLGVFTGMLIETSISMPFALSYILYANWGRPVFEHGFTYVHLMLFGTGLVTLLPLLLFSHAANNLPLSVLGLTQYLSPTIAFIIGVFFFKEAFTAVHLVSFGLIWFALFLFSLSGTKFMVSLQRKFGL